MAVVAIPVHRSARSRCPSWKEWRISCITWPALPGCITVSDTIHIIDIIPTVKICIAVNGAAWSGSSRMTRSHRQKPAPNARGWIRAQRSPVPGMSAPASSRTAVPAMASPTEVQAFAPNLEPSSTSRRGQTTTASEHKNAMVEAWQVCSPIPCAKYPKNANIPISSPGLIVSTLRFFNKGSMARDAIPKRTNAAADGSRLDSRIFTEPKFVPYSAATPKITRRAVDIPSSPATPGMSGVSFPP
mmetsp:Transcript_46638/g.146221  ORF Transcript_46638/g.146221 Transcript_46638/m.146221 type:complete len:244 (+) Transcript_46638:546-1277(+)